MIDKLFEKGEQYVLSGLFIEEDNLMAEAGLFKEGGLVENIAQTAALFAGLSYAEKGLPVPLGFIAGIKDLFFKQTCFYHQVIFLNRKTA